MAVRVFHPSDENYTGSELGIVMGNHFGSTINQDLGREAQDVADYLAMPVVTFERPGSVGMLPNRELANRISTPPGFVAEVRGLSGAISREIGREGLRQVVLTGHSASGTVALALTEAQVISEQAGVFAAEPYGWMPMQVSEGVRYLRAYTKWEGAWQNLLELQGRADELIIPDKPRLSRPQKLGRAASMAYHLAYDLEHNKRLGVSLVAALCAQDIAERQPDMPTVIEFAQISMAAPDDVYDKLPDTLVSRRAPGRAPFIVRKSGGEGHAATTHASYNDHRFMAGSIKYALEDMAIGS